MASIKPYVNGWRAQVYVKGQRASETFDTKREAENWALRKSIEFKDQAAGRTGEKKTLLDAMRKFGEEVSPTHKGARWEQIRLAMFEGDKALPLTIALAKITPQMLTAWKVKRLAEVSPASVRREMNLLGSVFSWARRDWAWIQKSPMEDVRKPPSPKHRERVISWQETKAVLRALKHRSGHRPQSLKNVVAMAFLLALRTGMRAGELVGMEWANVRGSWVELSDTKNGTARQVPLSSKAQRLVQLCRGQEKPLPITAGTLDALFRQARDKTGFDFRFHDARHTAATRIGRTVGQAGRLSFPEFCVMMGWRDPKHALIYVNPTGAELAKKLD